MRKRLLLHFFILNGRQHYAKEGNENEIRRTQEFEKRRLYSGNLVDEMETDKRVSSLGLAYRRGRKSNGLVCSVQWYVKASKKLRNALELNEISCANGYAGK